MEPPNSGIRLQNVTVQAGSRILLDRVQALFRQGEITLVVGPSGVGKSLLLKAIAGLIGTDDEGVRVSGHVQWDDQPLIPGTAGVVFQSFALFDELSPIDNLALAQSASHQSADKSPEAWLKELNVPSDVPT
ncbi:MAG TPA: ATP-binding cassette domain-containing protein, partial [Pirellulaceae bacterium]|nr:ATP-binding cassette domain-containing protein [Pirellulaceae bacterium]